MSDERKIKKLLEIMIENEYNIKTGLCGLNMFLFMSGEFTLNEKVRVDLYLSTHKPHNDSAYWWTEGYRKPRVEWLIRQIENL
jgi:hypothetical protein